VPRLSAAAALVLLAAAARAGSGVPHRRPGDASPVPVSGWPLYLENLTIGSPVADHGSHAGIKAAVEDDAGIPGHALANAAWYDARTESARQWDQSYFTVAVEGESAPRFFPAATRAIAFRPWGWVEDATDGAYTARAAAATLATDAFLFAVRVGGPNSTTVRFHFAQDADPVREQLGPLDASGDHCSATNATTWSCDNAAVFVRTVAGATLLMQEDRHAVYTAGTGTACVVVTVHGAAAPDPPADCDPDAVVARADAEWDAFFEKLPALAPDALDRDRTLQKLAATALRNNTYARRGRMPADAVVAAKTHFSIFAAWDTGFHSIGLADFDPPLARANLDVLFAGQREAGNLPYLTTDDMEPSYLPPEYSQPPNAPWAVWETYLAAGDRDWLAAMYPRAVRVTDFWRTERDADGDGLYEFLSAFETGWDDTPRYGCAAGPTNLCLQDGTAVDALDLAGWIHQDHEMLAEMARELGRAEEEQARRAEADALAARIEAAMWDETDGRYYDIKRKRSTGGGAGEPDHEMLRVKSPAMLWPLFTGAARKPERVARVLEHLLDPAEFMGAPPKAPVPTIAYGEAAYDHAQDGYYWQGQVWLVPLYAALVSLYRYGRADEAAALKERTLAMIAAADPGGIHETYDALTGEIGWGSGTGGPNGGVGEPSAFQFGWSSALTLAILDDRWQAEAYAMPGQREIAGRLRRVRALDGRDLLRVGGRDVPIARLSAGGAAVDLASAKSFTLELSDPGGRSGPRVTVQAFGETAQLAVPGTHTLPRGCGCATAASPWPALGFAAAALWARRAKARDTGARQPAGA
jgi:hypothetical protein